MSKRHKNKLQVRSIENPAVPLDSPVAYNYLGGPRASSGVVVDRHTVLGYPAFYRAVSLISGKVGSLPLNVYKKNKDSGREIDYEHDADWLLNRRPSSLYTPMTLRRTMTAQAMIHGNSYAWIVRDEVGRPQELIILDPDSTGIALNNGKLEYFYRVGTDTRRLLPENVLHIKNLSHSGLVGVSVIDVLREAVGLGLALQRYGSTYFRNGGNPGPIILKFPQKLDREQVQFQREQWERLHVGLDNAHKIAILSNGGDFAKFDIKNDDAQFLQSREFEVIQIANITGCPPHKLGAKISTSYNSLESEERAFLLDCLNQWFVEWEQQCSAKLLKESEQIRANRFIEFDRNAIEQADYKTRVEGLVLQVNNGLRSQNEARALLNMQSVGSDGDRLRMPANITFADLVGANKDTALPDSPPSTDADQPAENPAAPPGTQKEPVPDQFEVPRYQKLLTNVLTRFKTRLYKACDSSQKKDERFVLSEHIAILAESLDNEQTAQELLHTVSEELEAVTRDKQTAAIERIDINNWVERILKNGT